MISSPPPRILSIAGSDSSGGAGIQADLKTIAMLGGYGMSAITAVTAQNTLGVHAVEALDADFVMAQVDACLDDIGADGIKIGMLGSPTTARALARRLDSFAGPIVFDPVMVATSGAVLGDRDVQAAYRRVLLPAATLTTPNADEAEALLGRSLPARDAAAALADLGCMVLLTGGDPDGGECTDWWAVPGQVPVALPHEAVVTENDHGTGCTHSAALAALLALGEAPLEAATLAARFTADRLRAGRDWDLDRGRGPVAHTHSAPEETR